MKIKMNLKKWLEDLTEEQAAYVLSFFLFLVFSF